MSTVIRSAAHPVNLTPVKSSYVSAVGYEPRTRVLTVRHRSGKEYRYRNVGPAVHEALMESPSVGRFVAERIRGYYREQ